jgi:hypothetical protein
VGKVTAVPSDAGDLDLELLEMPLRWLKQKHLPDGRPIEQLDLILPFREDAMRLYDRARELGIERTLYIEDNRLWNPHPQFPWRDAPSPLRVAKAADGLSREDGIAVLEAARELHQAMKRQPLDEAVKAYVGRWPEHILEKARQAVQPLD